MFWNRDELPPELRDKKPAEIAERLKKLEELEAKAKEFETNRADLETKFKEQSTEFDQVKAKLQEFEQAAAQQQAQPYMQQQAQQPEPSNIWNDPDRYIQEKLVPTQLGVLVANRNTAKLMFERNLSPRDMKIYRKYEGEVDKAMEGYDWGKQGDARYWQMALTYIRGAHDQDISKLESGDSEFFSEPASRGATPEPPPEEKLTAEEEEVCRRFHFDPKGYLKQKKAMSLHQSDKGGYARFPVPKFERTNR